MWRFVASAKAAKDGNDGNDGKALRVFYRTRLLARCQTTPCLSDDGSG